MTKRENPLLQPSVSGGSKALSVALPKDPKLPVLDFGNVERVSRTAAVTANQYDATDGLALARALEKVKATVEGRVAGRKRAATFYYITYEVVVDGNNGPGRPMRTSAAGSATSVVFTGMPERQRAEAAA